MKLPGSDEYIPGGIIPVGRFSKKYSINSSNFMVTEEYLNPTGAENGEIITELIKKDYKVDSFLEAECLIRLLKQGIEIK